MPEEIVCDVVEEGEKGHGHDQICENGSDDGSEDKENFTVGNKNVFVVVSAEEVFEHVVFGDFFGVEPERLGIKDIKGDFD